MRSILKSTNQYEDWLRHQTDLQEKQLLKKHGQMAVGAFPFLRATFYRWAERWPELCPELHERDDDVLLAAGDLHVENFGTWRDSRDRLVWGINDFDEAAEMPFTSDLVRLGVSVVLAAEMARIAARLEEICRWLLAGYESGLNAGGGPILLENGRYPELLKWAGDSHDDPKKFWKKRFNDADNPVIAAAKLDDALADIFRASLPRGAELVFRRQRKPGGLGSLGRRRFTAVTGVGKKRIAREAKALVPSAVYWAEARSRMPSQTATLLQRAIRSPDPFLQIHDKWLVRQLAPDAVKIELPQNASDSRLALAPALIKLMGRETANIHLGSLSSRRLGDALASLRKQVSRSWLPNAVEKLIAVIRKDQQEWKDYCDANSAKKN